MTWRLYLRPLAFGLAICSIKPFKRFVYFSFNDRVTALDVAGDDTIHPGSLHQ
jgi:hypothetical protein